MDITGTLKSLLAALGVGALGWWAAVIALSWSKQGGAFTVGVLSIIIVILSIFGIWWATSDRSTTAWGMAVIYVILFLIIGAMLGGVRFGWFANWSWKDFGLGILVAALVGAAFTVVHARATRFK